jgi:hypothetical protein
MLMGNLSPWSLPYSGGFLVHVSYLLFFIVGQVEMTILGIDEVIRDGRCMVTMIHVNHQIISVFFKKNLSKNILQQSSLMMHQLLTIYIVLTSQVYMPNYMI